MKQQKAIRVLAFAKFQGAILAFVGLVAGICYAFGGLVYDVISTGSVNLGTALAFGALIGMPLLFGLGGACLGLVEAVFYNMVIRRWNRIDLDFLN